MKSDLLLIVGRSSQNRNPKDFRPRTNGQTDGLEFWNVSARRPGTGRQRITSQDGRFRATSGKRGCICRFASRLGGGQRLSHHRRRSRT